MLIEELIRLGRPLVEGGFTTEELVRLITHVDDPKARNYYRHVFVVELPPDNSDAEPVVLPLQVWGSVLEDDFQVERRAVAAPILLPSGGSPLAPQGRYGIPVYPCWDRHFQDFRASTDAVFDFLQGRLGRTLQFTLDEPRMRVVAARLHEAVAAVPVAAREKWLGVLVLAQPKEGDIFRYEPARAGGSAGQVGASRLRPGQAIVPDFPCMLERLWTARVAEGAGQGRRQGACSFSGEGDEAVSAYCTVWPWAFATWTCPVAHGGDTSLLVEGIGLSEATYRALTAGACAFQRLTRLIHPIVVHEVFSPVSDREGRNTASRRSLSDLPRVYGTAFLLPLQDQTLDEASVREDFAAGMRVMLQPPARDGALADRYLDSVTGFDVFLPEDLDCDDYRLTLVYFSGEPSRGDVHLRAYIQDVLPSVVKRLRDLARACAVEALRLLRLLMPGASERQQAYYQTCYRSVPYLLARAYGGSHLWTQLERTLHRRPLELGRLTANAAARLASLVPRFPDSRFEVNDEVIFYLSALGFLARVNRELCSQEGDEPMSMRPWPELLEVVERGPLEGLCFCPDDPSELGFACGVLVRQFSRWYWMATRVGTEGKDYLKHRVLTFGSDLSVAEVRRGLAQMFDLARRVARLHMPQQFERRVGAVLHQLDNRAQEVRTNRDSFLASFWSGYALQGSTQGPERTEAVSTTETNS